MKKLFLSFAALAAIVSCVEEKGLEPQQPVSGNQLTIKAVTAPATKTVLGDELPAEGISVLWEEDDAITVLLKDGNSGTAYKEFTAAQVDGTNADFTGEFTAADLEYFDTENVTAAYAVYPSASVSDGVITHTLSEEQDGEITSGMNLAYAALNADEVLNGTATSASFNNALALIQITVPADVMYVSLSTGATGDALVGEATFTYSDGVFKSSSFPKIRRTVTLKDGDGALTEGTYSLLVFPTGENTVTLKMEGTDGTVYEKSLNKIKFLASQCYTINLSHLSYVDATEDIYVSPEGGELIIPILTTEDYDYDVTVTCGNPADVWMSYAEVKSFHKDEIVLPFEKNKGETRNATVNVTIEGVGSKLFNVTQRGGYEPNLMNDYLESYRYNGSTYTGKLSIGISDDFTKGNYKVTGFLTYGQFSYTFYADYADKVLTLNGPAVTSSFGSQNASVRLNVSDDYKTITMDNQKIGYADISDYKAVITLGPAELTAEEEALVGIYDEKWQGVENKGGMEIAPSDEASFGQLKVTMVKSNGFYLTAYADLSNDGKTLTVHSAGKTHDYYGPMSEDIQLSYSDGIFAVAAIEFGGGYTCVNYTSTKQIAEGGENASLDRFKGIYSESYTMYGTTPTTSNKLTISVDGDYLILTNMFDAYGMLGKYKAELSADGKTLTIVEELVPISMGSVLNAELTVSEVNKKIVLRASGLLVDPNSGTPTFTNYTATQN